MMPKWRTIFRLGLFLLLGAAVNIAVAWSIANSATPTWHQSGPPLWAHLEQAMTPMELEALRHFVGIGFVPTPPEECTIYHIYPEQALGTGFRVCCWSEVEFPLACDRMRQGFLLGRCCVYQCSTGWPMPALTGESYNRSTILQRISSTAEDWQPHAAIMVRDRRDKWGTNDRTLPLFPIWPGFAINTAFYAGVCWLLAATPFAVRRFRRRRRINRGLCPACAYPVGTSEVCSECGTPKPVELRPARGDGM